MARRGRNDIQVSVVAEADFKRARKDAKRELDRIEDDAKDVAEEIERAFDGIELDPDIDLSELREGVDLAADLESISPTIDLDIDLSELRRGIQMAADLEQTRTVDVDVDDSSIDQIDDQLTEAGERGADGIADAIGDIDFDSIGGTAVNQLTGAISAAGPWGAAAGAAAGLFADDLIGGISDRVGRNRQVMLDSLSSGLPPGEVRRIGDEAGAAFTDGFGETLEELREDAILLISNLSDLPSAVDDSSLIRYGATAKQVFGIDIPEQVQTVRRLVGSDLVDTVEDAYQIMAASSQVFGLQSEENLEVLNEYAPVFSRLKIDGVDALGAIGAAARDGVFENTDMAADSLKEMLIRLDSLESADGLAQLGLDIGAVNEAIEQGRIDEVLATIGDRLGRVALDSDRAAVATEIFGTAIEGTNVDEFARWLGEIGENAPQATASIDEMAAAVEEGVGGWTALGRGIRDSTGALIEWFGVGEAGPTIGEMIGVDETAGLDEALDKLDRFALHMRASKEETEEWRQEVFDAFSLNLPDGLDAAIDDLARLEEQGRITGDEATALRDKLFESFETAESLRFNRLEAEVSDITDDFNLAGEAVRSLADEFADLEGRFDASSSLRRIQDQAESLLGSVESLEGGIFTAGGEFNRTDPFVRRFESTLEDLNGTLITAAQNLADGSIETDEFRVMQRNAEQAIRDAGAAAGLTDAEVQHLIDTYTRVPDSIETDVEADTSQAHGELNRFLSTANASSASVRLDADGSFARNELNRFLNLARNSRVSVPISGRSSGGGSVITRRSGGGPASGLVRVGEQGPELLNLGPVKGFVHDATRTASTTGQGDRMVLEIRSGGSAEDDYLVERIRRAAVVRGGGNVQVAFGRN